MRYIVLIISLCHHLSFGQIIWDNAIEVAPSSFGNNRPRIVSDASGYPLIIWGKSTDAYFTRWGGNEFIMPVKLNPDGVTIATADWMGPDIAAHGDTVYVIYKQTPEDAMTSHIWCRSSFDGGTTFNPPIQVDNTGTDRSRFPTITTDDSGQPIIAFMRFNSEFQEARWVVTRSYDFGETFTPDVLASGWSGPDSDVCDCCPGSIHCSGENVAIVYRDNNANLRDNWVGLSTDGGITFNAGTNVDQNGWVLQACPSSGADVVIVGDTLYSTFMNGKSGRATVYFNATSIPDLSNPPSSKVPGAGQGLQQNFSRIDAIGHAAGLLWRHSANLSTGLALLFTSEITQGWPTTFDTVVFSGVSNGDIALSNSQVFVAWQNNSDSNVMFRSGKYNAASSKEELAKSENLRIFPNPVLDELIFEKECNHVLIIDMFGHIMIKGRGKILNVRELPPGIYIIITDIGKGRFVKI